MIQNKARRQAVIVLLFVLGLLTLPVWSQEHDVDRASRSDTEAQGANGGDSNGAESAEAGQTAEDFPKSPWALTVYGAFFTTEKIGWAFLPPTDLEAGHGLLAGAVSRRMTTILGRADIELEGQIVKHFGSGSGELNAVAIGRWILFPWNHKLPTTIALGLGLSHATRVPALEALTHEQTGRTLTYVLFEGRCHTRTRAIGCSCTVFTTVPGSLVPSMAYAVLRTRLVSA